MRKYRDTFRDQLPETAVQPKAFEEQTFHATKVAIIENQLTMYAVY